MKIATHDGVKKGGPNDDKIHETKTKPCGCVTKIERNKQGKTVSVKKKYCKKCK